jgi:hypothetical protein
MVLAAASLATCTGASSRAPIDASPSLATSSVSGSQVLLSPGPSPLVPSLAASWPPEETILSAGGARAASGLQAVSGCSEADLRAEIVELRWALADQPGSAQRIDVTIFSELFADGRYESSPLLVADQSSFQWVRVSPGAVHFWRVLTLHADGWIPSETARFTPGACIGDYVSPP